MNLNKIIMINNKIDISVCILNYNNGEVTKKCIELFEILQQVCQLKL